MVHRSAPDWNREVEAAHRKGDVDLFGIQRDAARHEGDLIETVRPAGPPPDADLKARLLPGYRSAGFEPALIQGGLTPMGGGVAELYGNRVGGQGKNFFFV